MTSLSGLRQTRTYATMEVSWVTYEEIKAKLLEAGYQDQVVDGELDMHGIALVQAEHKV